VRRQHQGRQAEAESGLSSAFGGDGAGEPPWAKFDGIA
jgi:hypothetical protein